MQLVATGQAVKEKDFFCKSEFDTFEATVRQNFDPRNEANPQVKNWDWCIETLLLSAREELSSTRTHWPRTTQNRTLTISGL